MSTQIQIRRDTEANWESENPVLADGEIGYDKTNNRFKVGNGVDAWNDIEFSGSSVATEEQPNDPGKGDQWFDPSTGNLLIWNGSEWVIVGGGDNKIPILDTPPENPELGEQWFSSTDGYLYIWYGAEWVAVNMPTSSGDGGSEPDEGDPYWSDVVLLVNGDDEADGSTNIVDATNKHQLTVANGAKVSTSIYKYGTGSVAFTDATAHLRTTNSTFALQTNVDMTLEFWAKGEASETNVFITQASSTTPSSSAWWIETVSGKMCVYMSDGSKYTTIGDPNLWSSYGSDWIHVAWVNHNGTSTLYINGESKGTPAATPTPVGKFGFNIGGLGTAYNFNGHIDDLRITEGLARYTSNFTPPDKHPTKEAIKRAIVIQEDIPQTQEDGNDADLS